MATTTLPVFPVDRIRARLRRDSPLHVAVDRLALTKSWKDLSLDDLCQLKDDPDRITGAVRARAPPKFLQWIERWLVERPDEITEQLHTLGWLPNGLAAEAWQRASQRRLYQDLHERIAGCYEEPLLDEILQEYGEAARSVFYHIRHEELFAMLAEYPESQPAWLELKESGCGPPLQAVLQSRLNHPGANTLQIIDMYIATLQVVRLLGLEANVTASVRSYLRQRKDTIRCIVTSLTEGDLYAELKRPQPKDPKDDILGMLVGIYGSKDMFVNEYRILLADKLLANQDYVTDSEVHTLELLKLRFGETSLRQCEVMIKDMEDSKRANANISGETVDAVMLSHIFWPALQTEPLWHHHPRIQGPLDEFAQSYHKLKNPRKLVWLHPLGTVTMELKVGQYMKEFTCTPVQATLITHFADREVWTIEELSNECGLPTHSLQQRMEYWVSHGVVTTRSDGAYQLATEQHMEEAGNRMIVTEEAPDLAVSASAQEKEEMEVFESYIMGMLNRLGQLPLKTIHSNLKTHVTGSDIQYNKTPHQLAGFLQDLCSQRILECGPDGMYRIYKD